MTVSEQLPLNLYVEWWYMNPTKARELAVSNAVPNYQDFRRIQPYLDDAKASYFLK